MGCLKVVWIINLKEPGSTYSHSHRLEDTQSIAVAFKAYKEYSWCVGLGVRHLPFDSSKGKPESHALKLQKQKEEEKFRCAARVQKVSFFLEFSRFCGKKKISRSTVCWCMLKAHPQNGFVLQVRRAWILRFYCDLTSDKLNRILPAFQWRPAFVRTREMQWDHEGFKLVIGSRFEREKGIACVCIRIS